MKQYLFGLLFFLFAFNLNADTFRQSIGKGNFLLSASYEDLEINNKLTSSTSENVSTYNNTNDSPTKRDIIMLKGIYGLHNNIDIYMGIGYVDEIWNSKDKATGQNYAEQKGKDYAFEVGIKGTAYTFLNDKFSLAYLLKYNYLKTGKDSYTGPPNPTSYSSKWKEIDLELELGYDLSDYALTIFSGIGYLDLKAEQDIDLHHNEYENKDDIFYFVGFNKEIKDSFSIFAEAQFNAKESISLGISYKF